MIDWVNEKLILWADWARRRDDGGLGYAKDSPTCRLAASGTSGGIVLAESDALEIDSAMVFLAQERPELHRVGMEWYYHGSPAMVAAKRIGCHRDTVYSRLDALHIAVAKHLQERCSVKVRANA